MTIKECIDIVDNNKPNQYTIKEKVMWLSFIDEFIINEVLKTHEGYDGRYDGFEGYSEDKLSVPLIVPSPYDRLYTQYLKMKIDEENGETTRYNNSMVLYNSYMLEFRKYYNKTHLPLSAINRTNATPQKNNTVGLSDAEYENLKRDMTYILTEYFSKVISNDKLVTIITNYVNTNAEMLKGKNGNDGKDGYTPKRGTDYWTPDDIEDITNYIDDQTETIKSDIDGIQQQLNEEAHFRGYVSTNVKIQSLEATPNDYAYSAESGTVWVYDAVDGWQDTKETVPDQMTPASNATPLMNGEASVGKAEAYARGDHRHPTDTTRASAAELNNLKKDISTALDNIIAIQNTLIGGDSV